MNLPLNTNLTGKVAVVTGAGGVLCGMFAKSLAQAGAKVAVLDLNEEAAQKVADEIIANGGTAKAYKCNVLDKDSMEACHQAVLANLGACDILLNGAGGNNPRATTDKEYYEAGDLDTETKSFFDLEQKGVEFVFNLNFLGTLLPTQAFAKDMLGREGCNILNISSMNAYTPLTKIPAYSGAKAAISNFTQWLAVQNRHPRQRYRAGLFLDEAERGAPLERGRHAHGAHRQDSRRNPDGAFRRSRGAGRRSFVPAE